MEYFYGGALPKLKNGCVGEVVVPTFELANAADFARLDWSKVVPFLPEDSVILVRMRAAARDPKRKGCRLDPPMTPMWYGMFVEVILDKPLSLRLLGTRRATLQDVRCRIPALGCHAKSLNHAYRLISEVFEPTRRSHSGNVFEECFVERGNQWVPLDAVRSDAEARHEHLLHPAVEPTALELS
jgi:hypothetical protein